MNKTQATVKTKSATNKGRKVFTGNGYPDFLLSITYQKIFFSQQLRKTKLLKSPGKLTFFIYNIFFTSTFKVKRGKRSQFPLPEVMQKVKKTCSLEWNETNQPVSVNWPPTMGLHQTLEDITEAKDPVFCLQGLIFKTYKQLIKLNIKNKQPNQKMGRRSQQAFFQRRHTDGQQAHENMLNITNHRETQIKSTMRYHLTPVRMAIIKKNTNNKCW